MPVQKERALIVLTAHVPMLFSKYVHNEVVGNFMFSYAEGDGRVKVKKKIPEGFNMKVIHSHTSTSTTLR